MIINIFDGRLYIVGRPPTAVEFRKYGAVNPPYIGFSWNGKNFIRLAVEDIPSEIYEGNMLMESIPRTRTGHVDLAQKALERGQGYRPWQLRIDLSKKLPAN